MFYTYLQLLFGAAKVRLSLLFVMEGDGVALCE
jgi:hypothetical protein